MVTDMPRLHPRSVPRFATYDIEANYDVADDLGKFVGISVGLTGFSEAELAATGMIDAYFAEFGMTVGIPVRSTFLAAHIDTDHLPGSSFHGPLARNIIRMWYLGQWKQLPSVWVQNLTEEQSRAFNEFGRDKDRVISAEAYQEGLAWTAIGANPMGAKQPGFGSWAVAPE
jgi:hypothetical protein